MTIIIQIHEIRKLNSLDCPSNCPDKSIQLNKMRRIRIDSYELSMIPRKIRFVAIEIDRMSKMSKRIEQNKCHSKT